MLDTLGCILASLDQALIGGQRGKGTAMEECEFVGCHHAGELCEWHITAPALPLYPIDPLMRGFRRILCNNHIPTVQRDPLRYFSLDSDFADLTSVKNSRPVIHRFGIRRDAGGIGGRDDMNSDTGVLVREVLEATEPPTGPFLEVLMRARPAMLIAFGLAQQSRRSLEALLSLDTNALGDAGIPLVRTIFENAITGRWLLEGDDDELERFLGDQRKRINQSVQEGGLPLEFLGQYESLMETWVGHHESATMPNLHDRMGSKFEWAYDVYRQLSGRSHGSMISAAFQFAVKDDELVLAIPDAEDSQTNVMFAAQMLVALAGKIWGTISEDAAAPFVSLFKRLVHAMPEEISEEEGELLT